VSESHGSLGCSTPSHRLGRLSLFEVVSGAAVPRDGTEPPYESCPAALDLTHQGDPPVEVNPGGASAPRDRPCVRVPSALANRVL
jgi:hypothetical protein